MKVDINSKENIELREKVWLKMHTTVTVGTKWQIVIPQEVRELLNINPGDSMMVITKNGMAIWMIKMDNIDEMMKYVKQENCSQ